MSHRQRAITTRRKRIQRPFKPKISIFTTVTDPLDRKDLFYQALQSYRPLADEIVIVNGGQRIKKTGDRLWDVMIEHPWSQEFKWDFIGQQFQRGYDACTGDWVIRMDLDYILHEDSYATIKKNLRNHPQAHAAYFWKNQFLIADRYNLKSRPDLILNKKKFGDKFKLNGGGDLCQPTLNGKPLKRVMEIGAAVWNYDFLLKTEKIVKKDIGRFARAWTQEFGNNKLGGPDDDSAFEKFMEMQTGRFNRPQQIIDLTAHPAVMHNTLQRLTPEQFGYNMWGNTVEAKYFT
jgi:hypothetical protein